VVGFFYANETGDCHLLRVKWRPLRKLKLSRRWWHTVALLGLQRAKFVEPHGLNAVRFFVGLSPVAGEMGDCHLLRVKWEEVSPMARLLGWNERRPP
jgi:hypothetical protein